MSDLQRSSRVKDECEGPGAPIVLLLSAREFHPTTQDTRGVSKQCAAHCAALRNMLAEPLARSHEKE